MKAFHAMSIALAIAALDVCGEPSKGTSRRKSVVEQNDSVVVVRWARRALRPEPLRQRLIKSLRLWKRARKPIEHEAPGAVR